MARTTDRDIAESLPFPTNRPEAKLLFDKYLPKMIAGDIAEFGVWNGGATMHLLTYGRKVWAFDTFAGLPTEDFIPEMDDDNPVGQYAPNIDVEDFLRQQGATIMKGRFVDTLPLIPAGTVFAFVYVDCDYYLSTKQVLEYLDKHNHLRPGSMVLFDDYGLRGAHRAIENWMKSTGRVLTDWRLVII